MTELGQKLWLAEKFRQKKLKNSKLKTPRKSFTRKLSDLSCKAERCLWHCQVVTVTQHKLQVARPVFWVLEWASGSQRLRIWTSFLFAIIPLFWPCLRELLAG